MNKTLIDTIITQMFDTFGDEAYSDIATVVCNTASLLLQKDGYVDDVLYLHEAYTRIARERKVMRHDVR